MNAELDLVLEVELSPPYGLEVVVQPPWIALESELEKVLPLDGVLGPELKPAAELEMTLASQGALKAESETPLGLEKVLPP